MTFDGIGSAEYEFAALNQASYTLSGAAVPDLDANSIGIVVYVGHTYGAAIDGTISGATWGGTAMAEAVSLYNDPYNCVAIFKLENPPDNGNKDIVVSWSGGAQIRTGQIVAIWENADAAVSLDDTSSETGRTQNPDIVSTQIGTNEFVISVSATQANAVGDPSVTGCTELQRYDSGGNCSIVAYSIPASSGNATHQHNYSQSEDYAIASASFKEAAAKILTADKQTYGLTTSQTVNLKATRKLAAEARSYSMTGVATTFRKGYKMAADSRSYALAMPEVLFERSYVLGSQFASLDVTGVDVILARSRKFTVDSRSYSVSPVDVILKRTYVMGAEARSYDVTSFAAGLLAARKLVGETSSFSFSPVAVGFLFDRNLMAAVCDFDVTAIDATLTKSSAKTLPAESRSYSVTPVEVGLKADRLMPVTTGSLSFTPRSVILAKGRTIAAETKSFAVTFCPTGLLADRLMGAATCDFDLALKDALFRLDYILTAQRGDYSVTAFDVLLVKTGGRQLTAQTVAFTVTAWQASMRTSRKLTATKASYVVTFYDVTLTAGVGAKIIRMAASLLKSSTSFSLSKTGIAFGLKKPKNTFEVLR